MNLISDWLHSYDSNVDFTWYFGPKFRISNSLKIFELLTLNYQTNRSYKKTLKTLRQRKIRDRERNSHAGPRTLFEIDKRDKK